MNRNKDVSTRIRIDELRALYDDPGVGRGLPVNAFEPGGLNREGRLDSVGAGGKSAEYGTIIARFEYQNVDPFTAYVARHYNNHLSEKWEVRRDYVTRLEKLRETMASYLGFLTLDEAEAWADGWALNHATRNSYINEWHLRPAYLLGREMRKEWEAHRT